MTNYLSIGREDDLRGHYNKACFAFSHVIHKSALFDLENLVELSKSLPNSYWSTADSDVTGGWGSSAPRRRTLPETVRTLAESNSLVLLKGVGENPDFAPIYRDLMAQLEAEVGAALSDDITRSRATLILSSPARVTPYHIDAEVNFLLQLRGSKVVHVFDQSDRTLLTDEELEAFYGGNLDAAIYKPDRQADAHVFDFQPGSGVHIPIHAPHWTQNGAAVSVSLSINCSLRSGRRTAYVYKLNRALRERGQRPTPPGISPVRDRLKVAVGTGMHVAGKIAGLPMRFRSGAFGK